MKKEDIFNAFEELDPKFIEEAAPKMNKVKKNTFVLRIAAVAACVALLVSAVVVSTLLLNREDENHPDVPSEVTEPNAEKVNYVIYADFQTGSIPEFEGGDNYTLETSPIASKDFSFSNRTNIEKPTNVPETLMLKLQNREEEFEYVRTFSTPIVSNENFFHLGVMNEYKTNGEMVRINASTGEILFYANTQGDKVESGDFTTEEQAREKAEKILVELYGEKVLEEYTFDHFYGTDEDKKTCSILYLKKVFGYSTDDDILIKFNTQGEFIGINANKKGTMARAEDDLTREQIENAIKVLNEKNPGSPNRSIQLSIDSEGDYYLMTPMTLKDNNGNSIGILAYINIE